MDVRKALRPRSGPADCAWGAVRTGFWTKNGLFVTIRRPKTLAGQHLERLES
jgi:hypothetical protein